MGKCAWAHIDSPPIALPSNKFPKPFLLPSLEKFTIIASFIIPMLLNCMRLLPPKIPYGWSQNYVREANYSTTLRKRAGYQKRSLAIYSARYAWQSTICTRKASCTVTSSWRTSCWMNVVGSSSVTLVSPASLIREHTWRHIAVQQVMPLQKCWRERSTLDQVTIHSFLHNLTY